MQNGSEHVAPIVDVADPAGNTQRPRPAEKGRGGWLKPLGSMPRMAYLILALLGLIGFLAVWSLLTYTGVVDPLFLPTPAATLSDGVALFRDFHFLTDIGATVYRVLVGFILAAVVAVPLGTLMGVYRPLEALLEPLMSFSRYMPASAFVPLLILWVGIGDWEKIAVIFLGSFFSLVLMVSVNVQHVRRELLEAAYTLGAKNWTVLRRVVLPASIPFIYDTLRLVLGWAWTYIIVAELVAADSGIGYVILQSQRMLKTGDIIFGIVTIGAIGLISDLILKSAGKRLFRWLD
ncbi:MAG: ABC transporter permease [Alicyclobacillus sp.]|nr:ABC transporter permease [Alicyclobacillus sp.]